jgi:hypothetical protein
MRYRFFRFRHGQPCCKVVGLYTTSLLPRSHSFLRVNVFLHTEHLPQIELRHLPSRRQVADPNQRRSVDHDNAALTQTSPARFAADIMVADPRECEDELQEEDAEDSDEDPEEGPVACVGGGCAAWS